MKQGRPLRFLTGVLAGWTGLRVVLLWPAELPAPIAPALAKTDLLTVSDVPPTLAIGHDVSRVPVAQYIVSRAAGPHTSTIEASTGGEETPVTLPSAKLAEGPTARSPAAAPPVQRIPFAPLPARSAPWSRWAGDTWLALRPGDAGGLGVGQLGGSQAGARLTYALDRARRVALSARMFAPLRGGDAEAGLGIDLKPTSAPVHLLIEQRLGPSGMQPAIAIVAGGSIKLPMGLRLDAYGQGGAVARRGGFADGAAQLVAPVAGGNGARLEVGGGVWGAAQRSVGRLDVGPSAALVLPTGRAALRLQLDYDIM